MACVADYLPKGEHLARVDDIFAYVLCHVVKVELLLGEACRGEYRLREAKLVGKCWRISPLAECNTLLAIRYHADYYPCDTFSSG